MKSLQHGVAATTGIWGLVETNLDGSNLILFVLIKVGLHIKRQALLCYKSVKLLSASIFSHEKSGISNLSSAA